MKRTASVGNPKTSACRTTHTSLPLVTMSFGGEYLFPEAWKKINDTPVDGQYSKTELIRRGATEFYRCARAPRPPTPNAVLLVSRQLPSSCAKALARAPRPVARLAPAGLVWAGSFLGEKSRCAPLPPHHTPQARATPRKKCTPRPSSSSPRRCVLAPCACLQEGLPCGRLEAPRAALARADLL